MTFLYVCFLLVTILLAVLAIVFGIAVIGLALVSLIIRYDWSEKRMRSVALWGTLCLLEIIWFLWYITWAYHELVKVFL